MSRLRNIISTILTALPRQFERRNFRTSIRLSGKYFIVKDHNDFVENVMNSDIPVIVNFHADWCSPCHELTPKLKNLVEHSDGIALAIVDVEKHADLVHTFEVGAVPAVLAIRNGIIIDKFIGLVDSSVIENLIVNLGIDKNKTSDKNKKTDDTNVKSNDNK